MLDKQCFESPHAANELILQLPEEYCAKLVKDIVKVGLKIVQYLTHPLGQAASNKCARPTHQDTL
jgi:hypothetical protein